MSDIRKAFVSRWHEGYILELDFSQLEIYVLAFLSGDKQLKEDLLSGADLHGISATNLFGSHYTAKQRKIAKTLSFQLQYGAGAKSMAKTNNIDEKIARKFIELYYDRYSGVDEWQKNVAREVAKNRVPASADRQRTPSGNPAASSMLVTATGRRYYFQEQDAPDWTDFDTTFSPTQMKNFPVQGFATGDIVPLVLGKIHLYMANNHELWGNLVRLINTVHDSVVFDCKDRVTAITFAWQAQQIMESAPQYLKDYFGIDFDLPLKAGAEIGKNWHEMEEIEPVPF